jgi:hypothetical protein
MVQVAEEARLRLAALAYVIDLHNELTQENGVPPLGTQNQAVDFILGDPELRRALADRAADADIEEMTTALRRPPQDALYHRVRSYLEQIDGPRIFPAAKPLSSSRGPLSTLQTSDPAATIAILAPESECMVRF